MWLHCLRAPPLSWAVGAILCSPLPFYGPCLQNVLWEHHSCSSTMSRCPRVCIYCPLRYFRVAQAHLAPTHLGRCTDAALAFEDSVPSFLFHRGTPRIGHCNSGPCLDSLISYNCGSETDLPPSYSLLLHNQLNFRVPMNSTAAMLRQKAHAPQGASSAQRLPQCCTRVTVGKSHSNIWWGNNPHSFVLSVFRSVRVFKLMAAF